VYTMAVQILAHLLPDSKRPCLDGDEAVCGGDCCAIHDELCGVHVDWTAYLF